MRSDVAKPRRLLLTRALRLPGWVALTTVGILAGTAYYVALTWGLLLVGRALLGW